MNAHNKSDYGYEVLHWTKGAITGIDKYGWMADWPQLWYLYSIVIVMMLVYFIRKTDNVWLRCILFICTPFLGYVCYMFSFPKLIWNIDSASVLLFFCYIGFVLKNTFYASVHIYADGKEL